MGDGFEFEVVEDHIALFTLHREGKINLMTWKFCEDMARVFKQIKTDPNIRVVIISGKGRLFCGGMDFNDAA